LLTIPALLYPALKATNIKFCQRTTTSSPFDYGTQLQKKVYRKDWKRTMGIYQETYLAEIG
jgi:hypothetical protein